MGKFKVSKEKSCIRLSKGATSEVIAYTGELLHNFHSVVRLKVLKSHREEAGNKDLIIDEVEITSLGTVGPKQQLCK